MAVENKNIFITGSTDGIGKMLAIEFAKKGANIIAHGRNSKTLDSLYDALEEQGNGKHLIIEADLKYFNEQGALQVMHEINKHYECLDGIIHNAAVLGKLSPLESYDASIWEEILQVNLTAPFLLTKALIPLIKTSKFARIIFTSSGVATQGRSFWGAYNVSKIGLKGLAEIFDDEFQFKNNLKIFSFDPGATNTKMRAAAFPAENPNGVKDPLDLLACYEWFFEQESQVSKKSFFKYSDFHLPKDAKDTDTSKS